MQSNRDAVLRCIVQGMKDRAAASLYSGEKPRAGTITFPEKTLYTVTRRRLARRNHLDDELSVVRDFRDAAVQRKQCLQSDSACMAAAT